MIQTKINGVDLIYDIYDPQVDEIRAAFKLGATVKEIGQAVGADVAINFNYADNSTGTPIGRVIVDSNEVISDIPKTLARDELYMLPDRSIHIGKAPANAVWALQGSPRLLDGRKKVYTTTAKRDQLQESIWRGVHIRTAAGKTADGKLVVVRTKSAVSLDKLADIMLALGCVDALNADGGGSSYLWPADNGWGRKMGAALTVKRGVTNDMGKPLLVIDAGHGGSDPGAIGNGIVEKDYTLMISLYQYERFKELGVPVAITRTTDKFIDSTPRATMVKNSGATYCISNHINAGGGEGVETIHSIFAQPDFAKAIADAVTAAGQKFRRVFKREGMKLLVDAKGVPILKNGEKQYVLNGADYYYMHRQTGSVKTVIVEYGFVDNQACAERVKANWQAYAEAAVKGFCTFAKLPYTPPKIATKPPVSKPEPSELPKISSTVNVTVNGQEIKGGYLIDKTTYVPLRAIGEALGMQVGWDQESKTASLRGGK